MRIMVFAPLLLIAGCAGNGADAPMSAETQAGLDKALAGLVPGTPTSCVPLSYPRLDTRTFGRTILYREANGPVYRNDTTGGCEGAARGDILVQVELEGRPCSGDIIRTVEQGTHTTTGSCALGQFIPYTKPPAR